MTNYLYPERGHDYDFSYDYEKENVPHDSQILLQDIITDVRDILPLLGIFKDFTCEFIKTEKKIHKNILGLYIDGTTSHPYIGLFLKSITAATQRCHVDLQDTIETTIVHELGHAVQDALGLERQSKKAENQAEDLAFHWWKYREISPQFKKILENNP